VSYIVLYFATSTASAAAPPPITTYYYYGEYLSDSIRLADTGDK